MTTISDIEISKKLVEISRKNEGYALLDEIVNETGVDANTVKNYMKGLIDAGKATEFIHDGKRGYLLTGIDGVV